MTSLIQLALVVVLAVCAAWLAVRTWRSTRTTTRLAVGVPSAVVAVVLGVASVLGLIGAVRLYAPHSSPTANVVVQMTPDQLIVATRRASGCRGCHSSGTSPALDG